MLGHFEAKEPSNLALEFDLKEISHAAKFFLDRVRGTFNSYARCKRTEETDKVMSGQIDETINALIAVAGDFYTGSYREAYEANEKEAVPLIV